MQSRCGAISRIRVSGVQAPVLHSGWTLRPWHRLHHSPCGRNVAAVGGSSSSDKPQGRTAPHTPRQSTVRLPRGCTAEQVAEVEVAVCALGGPFRATPRALLHGVPHGGLTRLQLECILASWRQRLRREARREGSAGKALVLAPHSLPRPGLSGQQTRDGAAAPALGCSVKAAGRRLGKCWPAGVLGRVEAAVQELGGLEWASPTGILTLAPDVGLSHARLINYLRVRRRSGLQQDLAVPTVVSPRGRRRVASSNATGEDAKLVKRPAGSGPPHGWSRAQSKAFLAAVHALGGSAEATPSPVLELLQQQGPAVGALKLKQVDFGLIKLREVLRRVTGRSGAGGPKHATKARDGAAAIMSGLWLEGQRRPIVWTPHLVQRLEAAVDALGGPDAASPARLMPHLSDTALTRHQVASALQRLRARRYAAARSAAAGAAGATAPAAAAWVADAVAGGLEPAAQAGRAAHEETDWERGSLRD